MAGSGARAGGLQRGAGAQAGQAAGEGGLKLLPEFALVERQDTAVSRQTWPSAQKHQHSSSQAASEGGGKGG